tara:strand:+ start:768 stop:950 length:183 start_codon:yes stop_codon:yes gene_type:complete
MKIQILKKTKDTLIVEWDCPRKGFGQLSIIWDNKQQRFILDSEMMGIDFVLEILSAVNGG